MPADALEKATPSLAATFVRWLVVYGVLAAAWMAIGDGYAALFRAGGDALFEPWAGHVAIRFEAPRSDRRDWDTVAELRYGEARKRVPLDSRIIGYDPTVLTVALIAAMPFGWLRRVLSLLVGLVLVHVFVAVRVVLPVVDALSDADVGIFTLAAPLKAVLAETAILITRIPFSYVAPVFIWMVVAVRRRDWVWLVQPAETRTEGLRAAPAGLSHATEEGLTSAAAPSAPVQPRSAPGGPSS